MATARVLIVDDSALSRQILRRGLQEDPQIEVLAVASDPLKAASLIKKYNPNVLTLDVEMPGMNGIEFLKRLMASHPLPVVMVSSQTEKNSRITLEALALGAVDFILKPHRNIRNGLNLMMAELREKVKWAARARISPPIKKNPKSTINTIEPKRSLTRTDHVIAVGASTGGIMAIRRLLCALPAESPGLLIVQHLPPPFTSMFARRLDEQCEIRVKEARTGARVEPGLALIAPGDYHMQLVRFGLEYRVICRKGAPVNGHRPSVDVLFRSVARHAGARAIGVLLTGMGNDGAEALLQMRRAGARTVAQDRKSSVVFGMPREAFARGGAERLADINQIPEIINAYLNGTL
ncbi:protein-glutamate methylesterase/protein-glutamine glutaminase [Calditrichota bacterium GD2]